MQRNYKPLSVRRQERKSKHRLIFTVILSGVLLFASVNWLIPFFVGGLSFLNNFKDQPKQNNKDKVEDTSLAPPVLSIPYEATNSGAIRIKGYAEKDQKVEIYIDDVLKTTTSVNSDGQFETDEIDLSEGTNGIYGKTIDSENHNSLASKAIRIIFDNNKPELEVTEPIDNQNTNQSKVTVSGKVDPQDTTTLTVNSHRVIYNSDGNFSQSVELTPGENSITISALDQAGNNNQIIRKITYEP